MVRSCLGLISLLLVVTLIGAQRIAAPLYSPLIAVVAPSANTEPLINPVDGAELVSIAAGEFIMGSDSSEIDQVWQTFNWPDEWKQFTKNEQPAHRVRLAGFRMYRDDVTVAKFRRYGAVTRRSMPAAPSWGWIETHPMVKVSWEEAKALLMGQGAVTVRSRVGICRSRRQLGTW